MFGVQPIYFFNTGSTVHVAAASTLMFDIFNAGALNCRVLHIEHVVNLETAVTGVGFEWQLLRTTAIGTGGTGLTAWSNDASLMSLTWNASVTARLKASGGATASTSLRWWYTNSEETLAGNQILGGAAGCNLLPDVLVRAGGILLRQNQGLRINQETNSNAGNSAWLVGFVVDTEGAISAA